MGQATECIGICELTSCLVANGVTVHRQRQCPALDPCRFHLGYSLGFTEQERERFVIRLNHEVAAIQVSVKFPDCKDDRQSFLFQLRVICEGSGDVSSCWSYIMWERTAPIPRHMQVPTAFLYRSEPAGSLPLKLPWLF